MFFEQINISKQESPGGAKSSETRAVKPAEDFSGINIQKGTRRALQHEHTDDR